MKASLDTPLISKKTGIDFSEAVTVDEALESLPIGTFHYILLGLCGVAFMADSMEICLLSFISICAGDEWNLNDAEIGSIIGAMFAGEMAGSLVWGPVADKYGRRCAFMWAYAVITLSGIASAFAPGYVILVILQIILGFGVAGATVPFDLLSEFLPASQRGQFLIQINYFWTIGSLFVAGMAWLLLPTFGWRALAFVTILPVASVLILCYFYLPESPRWFLDKGKVEDAERVMRRTAKANGTTLPQSFALMIPSNYSADASNEGDIMESLLALMSPSNRKKSIAILVIWGMFGFGYYGIVLLISRIYNNSGDDEGVEDEDVCSFDYGSIFVSAISEVVGILAVQMVINSWGRVKSQAVFYGGAAASVLIFSLSVSDSIVIDDVLGGLSRGSIMAGSAATWVASPELFPTDIRATGHAWCSAVARLGAIAAPYVVLSDLSVPIVGIVLCISNLLSVVAVFFTPETAGALLDKVDTSSRRNSMMAVDDEEND